MKTSTFHQGHYTCHQWRHQWRHWRSQQWKHQPSIKDITIVISDVTEWTNNENINHISRTLHSSSVTSPKEQTMKASTIYQGHYTRHQWRHWRSHQWKHQPASKSWHSSSLTTLKTKMKTLMAVSTAWQTKHATVYRNDFDQLRL